MTYNGVPIDFSDASMPLNPNPNAPGNTPDIARLMRFIGDWIIIDWTASYAMALPSKIPDFFRAVGLSSELRSLNHQLVRAHLHNGNPVIFKARTSGFLGISFNHHIWVCEGYKNLPVQSYWMNWGWRGNANGWYYINDWEPEGGKNYSKDKKMITVF